MVATALRTRLAVCIVLAVCLSVAAVPASASASVNAGNATTTTTAMTATATGAVPVETPLSSGETFCRGERLHFEAQHPTLDAGKTYEVHAMGSERRVVAQFQLNKTGSVTMNTAGFAGESEERSFFLDDEDGDPIVVHHGDAERTGNATAASWTVRPGLCATFSEATAGATDWPYETGLFVGGDAETVEVTSETLNATELASVFGGNRTDDGVRLDVSDRRTIPVTFEYDFTGEHVFRVVADDGRNATARLTLTTSGVPASFASDGVYRVGPDGTAAVSLELDGPSVATVTASRGDVRLNATVRDADGDENVTLRYDASALSAGEDPKDGTVTTAGGDRLLSVTASEGDGSQTPGEYQLTSSVDGETTDATMLFVTQSNRTEATASPDGSRTTDSGETTTETSRTEPATSTAEPTPGVPGFGVGTALVAIALAVGLGTEIRQKRD